VWTAYSTRDAAQFVGLTESAVRGCVRAGLLSKDTSRLRFSFRDLLVLKMLKALVGSGLPLRRARRELAQLRRRVPPEASLASLSISTEGGHVVVRDGQHAYRADNGQLFFNFDMPAPQGDMQAMPVRHEVSGPEPMAERTPDDWFELALTLEDDDAEAAVAAYEKVLEARPSCTETLINLGRLRAELGQADAAEACFKMALAENPDDATAIYNLGVVAQDLGDDDQAVAHYHRALELDPGFAEAHYNLATIFDRQGQSQAAIRHINEYRKLTR
jgi:tetratricopeptide (TPR) repeat protein